MDRREFLVGAGVVTAAAFTASSCARSGPTGDHVIRYWGMGASDTDKDEAVREAFLATEEGQGMQIVIDQVPSSGVADMSQIITAVRGGTAPDLWWMDRFNAVQNASIGLLEPIDPLIEEYEDVSPEEFKRQWIQFAIDELTYDGQTYGLPTSTDARGLLYNENVLLESGIDLDMFDPEQHVITWDELREVARRITQVDSRGNYERFGFAPWIDEGWAYTWGFGLNAQVYDNATATITLDSPEWVSVFELFADWAEEFPYASVDAFYATYQPPNSPPSQSALFSGRLGMTTSGPWAIQGNEKYAPDLPLSFTWLPVTHADEPSRTWSGGQSLVIPKGANVTKNLWEYLKFHAGYPGQSIIQPLLGNLPTNLRAIEEDAFNPKAELFRQMLPNSTSRPPLPVGSAAWDALARTRGSVALGSMSPTEAAQSNQALIAPKMELFAGYTMPETYGTPSEVPGAQ
ncbi:extracellular solute-binding protein [Ruania halotolerans]|uniref:extracellular solute-binding protein n=1 Tax=Ruania halotolerans TaxID=2897773 RepID=UPI001E4B5A91|nr:extracellular solute-binding protein [Ruania halotolerans]UFU05525.1 extracellular solute-binding protein [Ruania halotolerans]